MIIFKKENRGYIGTLRLPTLSAVAIWHNEIVGHMCDGMWENTMPNDHWQFWADLDVEYAPFHQPSVVALLGDLLCKKTGYNIAGLYEYVGDRMLTQGRMGRALASLPPNVLGDLATSVTPMGTPEHPYTSWTLDLIIDAGEYMSAMTMEDWVKAKATNTWAEPFIAQKMIPVDDALAAIFFKTTYTMKDLRSDVKDIKAAIKTVKR